MTDDKKNLFDEKKILLLNRGKRGLLRLVFGRTGIVVVLLALQLLLLLDGFWTLVGLNLDGSTFYIVSTLLGVTVALLVVNRPANPAVKITWIFLILLAPMFAVPFYIFVTMEWGHHLVRNQVQETARKTAHYIPDDPEMIQELRQCSPQLGSLAAYMQNTNRQIFYRNSDVRYFPLGEAFFADVLKELERAEHFIFLEYFIIQEGYMWGSILRILEQKARAGVEVRVLYDGSCAVAKLPYHYPQKLHELGIQCKMYAPLRPLVSTHYNNRDHRKILVIDGRIAYTGGINLADEYINRRILYGHWKDTAVGVTGEAVRGFTMMFLQMWSVREPEPEDFSPFLDASVPVAAKGWVLPYGYSPFHHKKERSGEMVYIDILNQAAGYVHITTPYLIIDNEMVTALTFAAKRGVDVKLITPGIPDKKAVFALSRSYYPELLDGGVRIYEYTPGFVHAKMFVSDGNTAVVGSINLDYRSLYLHFECAAFLYACPAVADVERDFQNMLAQCREITAGDCKKDRLSRRLLGSVLRPLAPLM